MNQTNSLIKSNIEFELFHILANTKKARKKELQIFKYVGIWLKE